MLRQANTSSNSACATFCCCYCFLSQKSGYCALQDTKCYKCVPKSDLKRQLKDNPNAYASMSYARPYKHSLIKISAAHFSLRSYFVHKGNNVLSWLPSNEEALATDCDRRIFVQHKARPSKKGLVLVCRRAISCSDSRAPG